MFEQNSWCPLPFFHLSADTTGNIRACCRSQPLAHISLSTFKEAWNCESIRSIRRDFLNGKKPKACQSCWDYEAKGITSFRQRIESFVSTESSQKMRQLTTVETGEIKAPTKYLELKLTNKCNLVCRMCNPESSSRWAQFKKTGVGPVIHDHFSSMATKLEILEIVNHPEFETICFVGGEPFIDQAHFEYLSLIADKSKIAYVANTNLTHLQLGGQDVLESLKEFREITLFVSIDGDPVRQSYIRTGIDIEMFEKNLRRIQNANLSDKWTFNSTAVVSLLNIYHIPELIEYSLRFDLRPVPFTLLEGPAYLKLNLLPLQERQKIKEKIIAWYGTFDLNQFIESFDLKRVRKSFLQTKRSLDQSIMSVCNALDDVENGQALWDIFHKEMGQHDILGETSGPLVHPELYKILDEQS